MTRSIFRAGRLAAVATGLSMLAACVSIGGDSDPPEQLLTFTPRAVAEAGTTASGDAANSIQVLEPTVDDRLNVKRVPVQVSDTGVAYLEDAFYVEKPARLFQHLLAETVRAKTGRLVIEGTDPAIAPGMRLHGRISEMGFDAPSQSVTVTFDAIRLASDGSAVARRFTSRIEGIAPYAANVAPALNEAANDVAIEAADWLTGG